MYYICRECLSIWNGKKWFQDEKLVKELKRKGEDKYIYCSACKRLRDEIACGIVYLEADFVKEKKDEIEKLIRKEEELEQRHNHLSRILKIYLDNNRIVVETINQQLAVHIGKKMKKFYGGHLQIAGGRSGHHSRGADDREEVIVKWWK